MQRKKHTGNMGLFIIVGVVYVCILLLFGWQTWGFVNWLFPNDQLLMKDLTMLCFDIMALIWAVIDLFYHHATKGTRAIVRWGWGISFVLSFLASILYLVLQSFTRFSITPNPAMVNTGYTVTIIAITVTVLLVTFWLYQEWSIRHPHSDEYEYEVQQPQQASTPVQQQLSASSTPSHDADYAAFLAWRDQQNEQASQATLERLNEAMKMQEKRDNQSPLAMPDLTKANQNGTNGTH